MPRLTFNKMYIGLLVIAAVSAMVVPKPIPSKATAQLEILFAPVSKAARWFATPVYRKFNPVPRDAESPDTPRTYQQIAQENRELRLTLASQAEELRRLREINAQYESLGSLRQHGRQMKVVGVDASQRRSLSLEGPVEGLQRGMAVLYPGGLAGVLDRVGYSNGAQVQLVTDRGFRIGSRFGRLTPREGHAEFEAVGAMSVVLEGDGKSGMIARNVQMKDATEAGLKVGDWAVVADNQLPVALQGYRVGTVTAIRTSRSSPLFAEVVVEPQGNLQTLTEVMVLAR